MGFMAMRRSVIMLALLALMPAASAVGTSAPAAGASSGERASARDASREPASERAGQLTGKERLGEKWQDEQRVDNCNVPPDKRGTTPRPDDCAQPPPAGKASQ